MDIIVYFFIGYPDSLLWTVFCISLIEKFYLNFHKLTSD